MLRAGERDEQRVGVYAKTMMMIDSEPEIDLAKLAAVSAPALVLQGDRDEVTLEHEAGLSKGLVTARVRACTRSRRRPAIPRTPTTDRLRQPFRAVVHHPPVRCPPNDQPGILGCRRYL